MPSVTVSDASPLILLDKIGRLQLLRKMFREVLVTHQVAAEIGRSLPKWIKISSPPKSFGESLLTHTIGRGEASAIALAFSHKDSLIILDDRRARRVATQLGLIVTGTLGVIVQAKNAGYLRSVKRVLVDISKTDFRLSNDLIRKTLQLANE